MPFNIVDLVKQVYQYAQDNGPNQTLDALKSAQETPEVPQDQNFQQSMQASQALLNHSKLKLGMQSMKAFQKEGSSGDTVEGYRPDWKGKYGGKDGMETQPYKYDAAPIEENVRALVAAKDLGVPQLDAKQLATLLLKEGRSDFGTNSIKVTTKDGKTEYYDHDPNRPQEAKIYQGVLDKGFSTDAASFVTRMATKMETAKRLGIPFALAWNGTGKNVYKFTGVKADGHKYADEFHYFEEAANHPKNKKLVGLIQSLMDSNTQTASK